MMYIYLRNMIFFLLLFPRLSIIYVSKVINNLPIIQNSNDTFQLDETRYINSVGTRETRIYCVFSVIRRRLNL